MSLSIALVVCYCVASRIAYVGYIAVALRRQEVRGYFTTRWGIEGGFQRFRRVASIVMNNDAVSFVVLCLVSRNTMAMDLPRGAVIAAGVILIVVGVAIKLWAAATLGGRAYYWYNFFTGVEPRRNTQGPYRLLRNPMYTVGYLQTYGLALVMASLPGLLVALFDQATIIAFHLYVERPHLERISAGRAEPRIET